MEVNESGVHRSHPRKRRTESGKRTLWSRDSMLFTMATRSKSGALWRLYAGWPGTCPCVSAQCTARFGVDVIEGRWVMAQPHRRKACQAGVNAREQREGQDFPFALCQPSLPQWLVSRARLSSVRLSCPYLFHGVGGRRHIRHRDTVACNATEAIFFSRSCPNARSFSLLCISSVLAGRSYVSHTFPLTSSKT